MTKANIIIKDASGEEMVLTCINGKPSQLVNSIHRFLDFSRNTQIKVAPKLDETAEYTYLLDLGIKDFRVEGPGRKYKYKGKFRPWEPPSWMPKGSWLFQLRPNGWGISIHQPIQDGNNYLGFKSYIDADALAYLHNSTFTPPSHTRCLKIE